jgi:hypothetical protein
MYRLVSNTSVTPVRDSVEPMIREPSGSMTPAIFSKTDLLSAGVK